VTAAKSMIERAHECLELWPERLIAEAQLNLIRHLLSQLEYRGKQQRLLAFDPEIIFPFDAARLHGSIAR
jgi:hypothetical protein